MEETVERPDRFRKVKDLVQNVKTNATVKTVQSHLEENKKFYFGAAIGVAGCLIIVKHRAPVIAPVFNNTINNANNANIANFAGPMYKIVQDLDNPEQIWEQIGHLATEIAEKHQITYESARTLLSKHLNGHTPHVFNKTYRILGIGTGS